EEGPGTKWVGRSDGTYTVSALERPVEPGTRVTVRLSEDAGAFAEYWNLKALVERYSRMLPIPIVMRRGTFDQVVATWKRRRGCGRRRRARSGRLRRTGTSRRSRSWILRAGCRAWGACVAAAGATRRTCTGRTSRACS